MVPASKHHADVGAASMSVAVAVAGMTAAAADLNQATHDDPNEQTTALIHSNASKEPHHEAKMASTNPRENKQLDPAKIALGKRVGTGAFASVYEATCQGSKQKFVVKRLDRVAKEHMQQVCYWVTLLRAGARRLQATKGTSCTCYWLLSWGMVGQVCAVRV